MGGMKWLGIALMATVLLDVFPQCGGPKVSIQEPGQDCGNHGPRWRGDCRIGQCFSAERGGPSCTTSCSKDADCAAMGAEFRCTGKGHPYAGKESEITSICVRPVASAN